MQVAAADTTTEKQHRFHNKPLFGCPAERQKPPHLKMSWKSEVAQIILEINQREFTSNDIWKYLDRLIEKYPNANTPTVTVLITLGNLRDMGAIECVSRGKYRLTSDGRDILKRI